MKYIKITWQHTTEADLPCEIYSEIGDNNYEERKVEIYQDGRVAYAHLDTYPNTYVEVGTFLSYEEYPSLDVINGSEDSRETMSAVYITKEEFERIWFYQVNSKYFLQILKHTVQENIQGHLPLFRRIELYKQINDPRLINKIFFECIKKVFPVWREEFPVYTPLDKVMEDIDFYLYKNEDRVDNYLEVAEKYHNYVDAIHSQAGIVGSAIVRLCYSIYTDAEKVLNRKVDKEKDDSDFEYEEWLTDYCTELAWVEKGNSDIQVKKRHEFWFWFIEMVSTLMHTPIQPVLPLQILTE